jgi:hypothetical protein
MKSHYILVPIVALFFLIIRTYYRFMRWLHKRPGKWQTRKFEYYHYKLKKKG